MLLAGHNNAMYLNKDDARSRAGGHHYLSKNMSFPPNNSAIINVLQIIKAVITLAVEVELSSLYITAQKVDYIRQIIEVMGYFQPKHFF